MALGNRIFKSVNRYFQSLYKTLESPFSSKPKNSHIYIYPELRRMNKMMRNFYKKPKLQITATDNLVPFKFKTDDDVVIDGLQYITDPNSDKWIIASHWFAGHKWWSLYWSKPFIALGYNILVYDFRSHGQSEKFKYSTLGGYEKNDLLAAIKWLKANKKYSTLGLFGISMGGYCTNYTIASQADNLNEYKIKFAITDVAYGSIKTLLLHVKNVRFRHVLDKRNAKRLIDRIIIDQTKDTKIDWNDIDVFRFYENDIVKKTVPTLFSHGLNDKVTSATDSMRLFAARTKITSDDEIMIYNFSSHAFSLKSHYNRQIYNWLKFENKIIKDDIATARAMKEFGIDEKIILNNPEEINEVYSFYFNGSKQSKK